MEYNLMDLKCRIWLQRIW